MDSKSWWESKTIWLNVVAVAFGLLTAFHVALPADLTQDTVVGAIMSLVGVAGIVLRFVTGKPITPTS